MRPRTVRSRAPVRISFAGGGTDVSPYCDEHGGCVVNATITKYSYASLTQRADDKIAIAAADYVEKLLFHRISDISYDNRLDLIKAVVKKMSGDRGGFDIFMRSEVPPKSGLGSSAAAFVALIGMFNRLQGLKMSNYEIAETAVSLERTELGNMGGRQDQYACAFGGLNFIEFYRDSHVKVTPLKLKQEHALELEKSLLLVYVAPREKSGDIISDQMKRYGRGEKETVEALHESVLLAKEMKKALSEGHLGRFGELLDLSWKQKKKFSPLISNPNIEKIYRIAKEAGALGGKISGAGGGGFMFFFCDVDKEYNVSVRLGELGLNPMPVHFDSHGMRAWEA